MKRKKRVEAASFSLWFPTGLAIGFTLLGLSYVVLAMIPWGIFGFGGPGPPQPLDLPLVSSALGWFVLLFTVGFTALGIWLDRGREKRIDPLVRIALCLSVLGIAEAISGANWMASGIYWPVNLVHAAFWTLLTAMVVGVLSWIRLLLARGAVRGWILAICSVFCSAGAAWYLYAHLFHFGPPLPDDGIELPIVDYSRLDQPWPDEYRPKLRIGVGGAEDLPDLTEIAARMAKESYSPSDGPPIEILDDPVLIRADARASWASVREVLAKVKEVRIWKVQFAARWSTPPAPTRISAYFPRAERIHVPDAVPPPPNITSSLAEMAVRPWTERRSRRPTPWLLTSVR